MYTSSKFDIQITCTILAMLCTLPVNTCQAKPSRHHKNYNWTTKNGRTMRELQGEYLLSAAICQNNAQVQPILVDTFHETGVLYDNNKPFKCYLACLLGLGRMISGSKIQAEVIDKVINKIVIESRRASVQNAVHKCSHTEDKDIEACEAAFFKCLHSVGVEWSTQNRETSTPSTTIQTLPQNKF